MKIKLFLKTDLGIDFLIDDGKKSHWIICLTHSGNYTNRYTTIERLEKYEN